jgi:hypothetical protein
MAYYLEHGSGQDKNSYSSCPTLAKATHTTNAKPGPTLSDTQHNTAYHVT